MLLFPLTAAEWTVLLAVSIALAALGTEYLARPIFAGEHWTNDLAAAVMWSGRAGVWLALFLGVGGQVIA
ncbi:hypothetical protein C5748_07345 [Phyllobacterium phragmitis]|uniref:Uncharacterized protein n=1 Tax=Phyllobacterium phragmitis TaxID=2670329 RepID=A0A2S9IV53_9HYPH|nr:hypothetical protein [Phyllobacterium phragmitis]PRD44385.1 hypothetical protein C5748_07345 [Phyllobacterium phragmitis]